MKGIIGVSVWGGDGDNSHTKPFVNDIKFPSPFISGFNTKKLFLYTSSKKFIYSNEKRNFSFIFDKALNTKRD